MSKLELTSPDTHCTGCGVRLTGRMKVLCMHCREKEAVQAMKTEPVGNSGDAEPAKPVRPNLPTREEVSMAQQHNEARRNHYRGLLDPKQFDHIVQMLKQELEYIQNLLVNAYSDRNRAPEVLKDCDLIDERLRSTLSDIIKQEIADRKAADIRRGKRLPDSQKPKSGARASSAPTFNEDEIKKFTEFGMPRERVIAMFKRAGAVPAQGVKE